MWGPNMKSLSVRTDAEFDFYCILILLCGLQRQIAMVNLQSNLICRLQNLWYFSIRPSERCVGDLDQLECETLAELIRLYDPSNNDYILDESQRYWCRLSHSTRYKTPFLIT
jgi:hypothetical protein